MKRMVALVLTLTLLVQLGTFTFASEAISYGDLLFDLGIIKGTDDGLMANRELSREEMVAIICRLSGDFDDYNPQSEPTFKDVPSDHWAYKYIEYANASQVTEGIGNGYFGIGQAVNTNQASLFLIRALGYKTDGINYNRAYEEIADRYGLELSIEPSQGKLLLRYDIFELLSKLLMMDIYNAVKFIDTLGIDEERVIDFKNGFEEISADLFPWVVPVVTLSNNPDFPVRPRHPMDYKTFASTPHFTQELEKQYFDMDNLDIEKQLEFINDHFMGDYEVIDCIDFRDAYFYRINRGGNKIEYTARDIAYDYTKEPIFDPTIDRHVARHVKVSLIFSLSSDKNITIFYQNSKPDGTLLTGQESIAKITEVRKYDGGNYYAIFFTEGYDSDTWKLMEGQKHEGYIIYRIDEEGMTIEEIYGYTSGQYFDYQYDLNQRD